MSERKTVSKYHPPDFDPSMLSTQLNRPRYGEAPRLPTVRLGAPFTMKCGSCDEYIGKGKRFNARKETADDKYLNVPLYRFYIRCPRCSNEIAFRTDPSVTDYAVERGAQRTLDPFLKAKRAWIEEERALRLGSDASEETQQDKMEELEAKAVDVGREMAVADALDRVQSQNARREQVIQGIVKNVESSKESRREKLAEDAEDAEIARVAFAKKRSREETSESVEAEHESPDWNSSATRNRPRKQKPGLLLRRKKREPETECTD